MASQNLAAMLKDRQAAQLALAANGAGVKKDEVAGVVTGMQSSVEAVQQAATVPPPVKGEVDKTLAEGALAVYEDNDNRPVRRIVRTRGGKTVAVNGYFYAKDEDDVKILEQYVVKGLVTKVEDQLPLDTTTK